MKKFCMIIMLAVCLGSCGEGNPPHGNDNMSILDELRAQKAMWESLGIDHYRYSVVSQWDSVSPEPPSTYVIFPDREPEWMITPEEEAWYARYLPGWDWRNFTPPTISKIFDNIEYSIVDARENEVHEVRYNEKYHYPEYHNMSMKSSKPGEMLAGGWYYLRITAFEDLRE